MRKTRYITTGRCYHLISRLAHQAFFLTDEEKDRAVGLLRRVEEFSGVLVLAYAIMSNHFHIFIYIPAAEGIGEEDKKYVSRFSEYKAAFVKRMCNSSEFMRTFKQHFTMSFNGRRDHHGTMFEGRYHERNHPPEETVMWKTSAYIDVNPVNAGICAWPDQYKWCSFAVACAGDVKARRGYAFMYGGGDDWQTIREAHEISIRKALDEIAISKLAEEENRAMVFHRHGRIAHADEKASKVGSVLEMPRERRVVLERGDSEVAEKILNALKDGPAKPSQLRQAAGIKSRIHFIRYYLAPMLEQGLIARTDPDHPQSPQQQYRLV